MTKTNIDYELLLDTSRVLGRIISLMYGLICVVIALWITVVSVFDVVYMLNPTLKGVIDNRFPDRKVGWIRIISNDAARAVEDAYMNGSQPLMYYLKYRIKTYVIASFTLVILITGGDSLKNIITTFVINLLSALRWL